MYRKKKRVILQLFTVQTASSLLRKFHIQAHQLISPAYAKCGGTKAELCDNAVKMFHRFSGRLVVVVPFLKIIVFIVQLKMTQTCTGKINVLVRHPAFHHVSLKAPGHPIFFLP